MAYTGNNQYQPESEKSKTKKFWKKFGLWALAIALAFFTVIVINV